MKNDQLLGAHGKEQLWHLVPQGPRLPNFVIRMPPDLQKLLDKEAKRRHLTVGGLIKDILWQALEKGKEGKG